MYSPLTPINIFAYTHHPHLSYTLKKGAGARVFVSLSGFCILMADFTVSVSQFHPQVMPKHLKVDSINSYVPATHTKSQRKTLLTQTNMMWWVQLPNHQRTETAWWSNGRFRITDSCGNYTTTLSCWALSNGMVSICSSVAQRKCKKSTKTPRISHASFWKIQGNRRSSDLVWCWWTIVSWQAPFQCSCSVHKTSKQLQIITASVQTSLYDAMKHFRP